MVSVDFSGMLRKNKMVGEIIFCTPNSLPECWRQQSKKSDWQYFSQNWQRN
jgi:hypothetical protein